MARETDRLHRQFDEQVAGYCFGDLTDEQRAAFEVHLLTCDMCFREVERLLVGVNALKAGVNAASGSLNRADVIGLLGISGDLDERFAGHGRFVALATMGYAFLSAEAMLTELSYFIDRFGHVAVWTVPLAFVLVGAAVFGALSVGLKLTHADRSDALLWSSVTLIGTVGVLLVGAQFVLPHEPSISAVFVPRTVATANLKNYVLYGLPLALVFLLVPFQFVVTIQRELGRGRQESVLRFFSKDSMAISPRGAIFVPPWALGALFVVAVIYLVIATQYLLDNLTPGPHSELFATLIYVRIATALSLAGGTLAWYARMLNEAKREALALRSPDGTLAP